MNKRKRPNRRNFLKSVGLSAIAVNTAFLPGCGGSDAPAPDSIRRVHLALPTFASSAPGAVNAPIDISLIHDNR
jgi:hypothetical protein